MSKYSIINVLDSTKKPLNRGCAYVRPIYVIQADIINTEGQIQAGRADQFQLELWNMQVVDFKKELAEARAAERDQAQEEEVQAITLPYDFNELLSEEGHAITNANEMIIEVVRDFKRQANVEKNQALDEQKAEYNEKLRKESDTIVTFRINNDELRETLEVMENQINNYRLNLNQSNIERDDAFNKRDAAFRQLQEAQDEITALKIKLENAPTAQKTLDISPSDKLAQMVKNSLAEKVNRGLARWNIPEIPAVEELPAQIEQVTQFPEEDLRLAAFGGPEEAAGNTTTDSLVEQPESQVITLESLHARITALEEKADELEAKQVA